METQGIKIEDLNKEISLKPRKQVFTAKQEEILITRCDGLTESEVRKLAWEFAQENNVKVPASWRREEKAGHEWFRGFSKRHSDKEPTRIPESCSTAYAISFNMHAVKDINNELEQVTVRDVSCGDDSRIYNLEETTDSMEENTGGNFEVGDFVFAKLKGHPHWPATISQIETVYTNGNERTMYNVYFYGSHQMSMVKVRAIVNYSDHYNLLKRKHATNPKFIAALEELEADLESRDRYLQNLRECLVKSGRHEVEDVPEDEMFSVSDGYNEPVTALSEQLHITETSSRFSEGFESDEDYHTCRDQKFEILSMEKVLFPGTPDFFLNLSLGFNEEDLMEDYEYIENQLRMMQCYVQLERLPDKRRFHCSPKVHYEVQRKQVIPVIPDSAGINENCTMKTQVHPAEGVPKKRRGRKKTSKPEEPKEKYKHWKTSYLNNKLSSAYIAAAAVKRRRRRRKSTIRNETRIDSLRLKNSGASENQSTVGKNCSCLSEPCKCNEIEPITITCPICQAQFSSNVDYKQHSFNIHIMGL